MCTCLSRFHCAIILFPYCFLVLSVFEKLNSHKVYLSKYICLVQDPSPNCTSLWWWITGTCSSPGHISVGALVPDTSARRKLKIFPSCKWLHLCTGTDRSYLNIFPTVYIFPALGSIIQLLNWTLLKVQKAKAELGLFFGPSLIINLFEILSRFPPWEMQLSKNPPYLCGI